MKKTWKASFYFRIEACKAIERKSKTLSWINVKDVLNVNSHWNKP